MSNKVINDCIQYTFYNIMIVNSNTIDFDYGVLKRNLEQTMYEFENLKFDFRNLRF